ncbi:MAG: hypothetical protein ACI8ZM_001945 [Crocinitomix sp.]|jgi:uncharacterized protein YbaP (TraB family)
MRKRFTPYIILLLPFLSCASNTAETAIDQNQDQSQDVIVKNGQSMLWKVEGADIKTSYLFGTMHMINEEYYRFSENLTDRIENSDAVIMEVGGMPNPFKTFQLMSLDTGTVHSYFTNEQLIELLAFMDQEQGMTPQEFDQTYGAMKPFFLLQTITQNYFEATAKSYDLTIMSIAGEKEIPLIGLETIEEQLGFFDQVPTDKMADMIIESIRDYEKEAKNTLKLMELYSKEKVDKLIPLLNKQSPEFMEFADLFLYDRNRAWVPKLAEEMKDKSCFIAVGAGHLFGDNGLIDLFQKKGYTLTAISSE